MGYIDVTFGVVKQSHHVVFDEAWYLQPSQTPAAQLLYNLGLEDESPTCVTVNNSTIALYPPMPCLTAKGPNKVHTAACHMHLPLQELGSPITYGAQAATVKEDDPYHGTALKGNHDTMIVDELGITWCDVEQVFFSASAYKDEFEDI
jgi:hypothetical protein